MRPWPAALLAMLIALPAAALALPAPCPNVHDAAQLPDAARELAAARAAGFDVSQATTLRAPAPAPGRDSPFDPPTLPDLPGASECRGLIRPGAPLLIGPRTGELWFLCTADWIFEDAAGALYLGTAGHCVPGLDWTYLVIPGVGDIGDPVFRQADGIGHDFALIRIDPALYGKVEPTLCRWGGPTSEIAPLVPNLPVIGGPVMLEGQVGLHYGWGVWYNANADTRGRAGDIVGEDYDPDTAMGALAVSPGDSGSPAENELGQAVGIVTHTIILTPVPGQPPLGDGVTFMTRVDQAERMVRDATRLSVHVKAGMHPVDLTGLFTP